MRPLTLSSFVTAALTAVLFSYVIGLGGGPAGLESLLSDDDYVNAGLDKLTHEERAVLFSLLCVPRGDFLVETAMRRMENDRWQPIDLMAYGVRKEDTRWPEKYAIFARGGELWRFELPGAWDDLEPGRYWAKADGHVWTLLRPDGSTDNLWPLSDH